MTQYNSEHFSSGLLGLTASMYKCCLWIWI